MRLRDLSVLVDDVCDAAGVLVLRRVGGAVGEADPALGVAEEREREVVFLREGGVGALVVEADAEDRGVLRRVLIAEVPEPGTFARSTGGVGFRVEPEHDPASAEVAELHAISVVIGDVEVGSFLAWLQHLRFPSGDHADDAADGHAAIVWRVTLDEWNERYRTRETLDDEPAPLLVNAARDLPPGRALDLACGAGRNAVWLAQRGWDVVAIDGASEAIRVLREREPRVDARVLDLETSAPLPFDDETFDLVAILFYLHRPLFAEARRLLRHGGIIVAAARMSGTFAIGPGELRAAFGDLTLVHEREGEIAEIVVRKN